MNLTWKKKSKTTDDDIDLKNGTKNVRTETKKFSGDGLILYLDTNERDIEIIGDGCKVTVTVNSGKIRIYGDGCHLKIQNNSGYIEYRGDGGRVSLGAESALRKIDYIGEGGKVDVGKDKSHVKQCFETVESKNQVGLDLPRKNFFSSDPMRKKNSPHISTKKNRNSTDPKLKNESSIDSNEKKSSPNNPTRQTTFDNFADEFLKSKNIDANFDKKKQPEQCIRTTIKTVRIYYDNANSVLPKKSRSRTKIVNFCSIQT